jgi:arabinose-5-phosphate isomerase
MAMSSTRIEPLGSEVSPDLASAERVLRIEVEGLRALSRNLDQSFIRALDIISKVSGRIVVTGIGKSGHVGHKIAATLASTGSPAFFVHSAEASHGDLGMITKKDAVLALSNSGETAELADIITYAKRFGIPLVGVTANRPSALADAADVVLVVPASEEACPMGLAPTTSTTVMMALGDTLAVALLERRGFSADDFQLFHPGGKLGQILLKVSEIMHCDDALPLTDRTSPMSESLLVMTAKRFGCVGVVDEGGALVGIITDGDLRRNMSANLLDRRADTVMTADPQTIGPESLASEAVQIMNAKTITSLFVVDQNRPIGIVHIHDCLRMGAA